MPGNRIEERLAARQSRPGIGRLEIGERRQDLRERVRLVLEPAERDAWHDASDLTRFRLAAMKP